MEANRVKEISVLHALVLQAPGRPGAVEDLPREISKPGFHQLPEDFVIFVPQGVVQPSGSPPSGHLCRGLPSRFRPGPHEGRHAGHVLSPHPAGPGPIRQDPFGCLLKDSMEARARTGWRGRQVHGWSR